MKNTLRLSLVLALGALGCAGEGPPRLFNNNDLELATGNSARMGCSCLFVMEMSEDYCRAWVKARPDIATFSVDRANKRVQSSAFLTWVATARYVDDQRGCVLE